MNSLLYMIFTINLVSFFMMGIDKFKAKHHCWRIAETTLLLFAAIGGSIGILAGMIFFHHKTRKKKFIFGVPLLLIIQVLCLTCYCIYDVGL